MERRNILPSPSSLLWVQAFFLAAAMLAIMLLPPARGAMLLVPLTPAAARTTLELLPAADVRLVGRGPLPHSLIVMAERRATLRALIGTSTLIVSAPRLLCGQLPPGENS